MQNLYIILLFLYLSFIQIQLSSSFEYAPARIRQCRLHKLSDCPEFSECTQVSGSKIGECYCVGDYIHYKYNDDKIYCVLNPISKTTTTTTTELNNAINVPNNSNTATVTISTEHNTIEEHNHIVGGILIPVFIILFIIFTAYGIKRLEIIRRFREYQLRRRRQRPFYEDVMMSQDTNDDPPLI